MSDNTPRTLGIEFESVVTTKEEMVRILSSDISIKRILKMVTRDASIESTFMCINNTSSKIFLGNKWLREHIVNNSIVVGGYEAVTVPLELSSMRDTIKKITSVEESYGEIFSNRASIHIHTGYPSGFIFLKTAIALGLVVEPLLYKIAGMTKPYRGLENDSAYCRALSIPPAVKLNDSKGYAVLNPSAGIKATSVSEFWNQFGIDPSNRERYNPLRYLCINVFSILLRGTLEYRFFNFTTKPAHIEAVASLCRFISDLMLRIPLQTIKELDILSLNCTHTDLEYIKLLNKLILLGKDYGCELLMERRDYLTILSLIERTPQPVFINEYVLSHVRDPIISRGQAIEYGLELVDHAKIPNIIDIHNFNESDRKLGD